MRGLLDAYTLSSDVGLVEDILSDRGWGGDLVLILVLEIDQLHWFDLKL